MHFRTPLKVSWPPLFPFLFSFCIFSQLRFVYFSHLASFLSFFFLITITSFFFFFLVLYLHAACPFFFFSFFLFHCKDVDVNVGVSVLVVCGHGFSACGPFRNPKQKQTQNSRGSLTSEELLLVFGATSAYLCFSAGEWKYKVLFCCCWRNSLLRGRLYCSVSNRWY